MKRSMESSQPAFSPATLLLLCNENSCSFDDSRCVHDGDEDNLTDGLKIENGELLADHDQYIELILEREMIVDRETSEFSQDPSIQSARSEGIQHILETKDGLGLGFQTAYAAVTYLHRFLAKASSLVAEKSWTIRVVATACLYLAAKMEENGLPPALKRVIYEESNVIQRTELVVLNTLEWRMVTVTPFAFIRFFTGKFSLPSNGLSTVVDLILASVRDEKIMSHRPSVIAAAAILVVLDRGLTKDVFEISPFNSAYSFKLEDMFSCYDLLKVMEIEGAR